jgi:hypothetical protein
MHWTAIAQGIVTALLVSGIIASRKHVKNWILRRTIQRMLIGANLGHGVIGLTTTVRNKSQVEIRVREVFLLTPTMKYQFKPAGEESSNQHLAALFGASGAKPPSESPFPRVPPLTNYTYLLPAGFISRFKGPFLGISIKMDYDSHTGHRKVVEVESDERANELSRKAIAHYEWEFQNGNLNKARATWNLPPIPPASPAAASLEA